jgi:hypothetical protein
MYNLDFVISHYFKRFIHLDEIQFMATNYFKFVLDYNFSDLFISLLLRKIDSS